MPHKTRLGVQQVAHVRGFQEFLERAEKDRLERLPADTFHRWLPWAIALGVTERWIFNFQGLRVSTPSWYMSRGDFSLPSFAHELSAFSRRAEEAILTTRRGYGAAIGAAGGGGFSRGSSGAGWAGGRRDVLSVSRACPAHLGRGVALPVALGYHSVVKSSLPVMERAYELARFDRGIHRPGVRRLSSCNRCCREADHGHQTARRNVAGLVTSQLSGSERVLMTVKEDGSYQSSTTRDGGNAHGRQILSASRQGPVQVVAERRDRGGSEDKGKTTLTLSPEGSFNPVTGPATYERVK